jgi:creatinine amidohydrolase
MRLSDLSWFDVKSYLENDDRIMLVLGSCEQHGYLSLLTDTKIPIALADAAGQQTGVLLALDLAEDIIRSLHGHGFRRILVLNGHGGNDPVRGRLYEVASDLSDLRMAWYAWWQSHSVEVICQKYGLKPFHASWLEAFPFTRVGDLPQGKKQPPSVPGLIGAQEARGVYGDGVFGGEYQVDDAIMNEIFAACVADVVHLLCFER